MTSGSNDSDKLKHFAEASQTWMCIRGIKCIYMKPDSFVLRKEEFVAKQVSRWTGRAQIIYGAAVNTKKTI